MKSHAITIGDRFGAWVVIGAPYREKRGEGRSANYLLRYPCRCACGTERGVRAFKLLANSRSCGCLKRATLVANIRHGQNRIGARSRLYTTWSGMIQRCTNPRHRHFAVYGGRGIAVCEAWRDFAVFAAWAAGSGYEDSKQIDRIDNDGGYAPENCRWVSEAENKRNTSQNYFVTAFGETKCLTDWALDPRCSVTPSIIRRRIRVQGLPVEQAISAPRANHRRSPRFAGYHR